MNRVLINRALDALFGVRLVRSSTIEHLRTLPGLAPSAGAAPDSLVVEHDRVAAQTMQTIFGNRMYLNPDDLGFRGVYTLAGRRAEDLGGEYGYITRNLHAGQTAIDIGANIGLMTLLMANRVGPTGSVHAFEPGPVSFGLLQANVGFNRLSQVRVHNAAVAETTGPISLNVCVSGESDNRLSGLRSGDAEPGPEFYTIESRAIRLDDLITGPVDYIKMDVQGAEYLALLGMRETIARSPNLHMTVEFTPHATLIPPSEYLKFIRSMGFDIYDLPEGGVESRVPDSWLLENIGISDRQQTNLVLRKK
jgi:FkbM family methyltransferase